MVFGEWWSSESGRSVVAAVAATGCGGWWVAGDAAVQFAGHVETRR
mgnify:CR=1 FL=1